jgi:hypothetical protein
VKNVVSKKWLSLISVHGHWSAWQEWSDCVMVQCGMANRTRSRSCDSPSPTHGGAGCQGNDEEIKSCERLLCPSEERKAIL